MCKGRTHDSFATELLAACKAKSVIECMIAASVHCLQMHIMQNTCVPTCIVTDDLMSNMSSRLVLRDTFWSKPAPLSLFHFLYPAGR